MPGMDMGQLGTSLSGMNVSADYRLPQQPNPFGVLSALGGLGNQGAQQMPQRMAPPAQLQAGGGQFALPYQFQPVQTKPTAQALQGLLGSIYGTS